MVLLSIRPNVPKNRDKQNKMLINIDKFKWKNKLTFPQVVIHLVDGTVGSSKQNDNVILLAVIS